MTEQAHFWNESNWFAIQTRPYQERLAEVNIAGADVEVFLPLIKRRQSVCGVVRLLTLPLFRGYLFARFIPFVCIDSIRFSRGVLRVIGNSRFPIPVEPEIVASIQERVQPDGLIHLRAFTFESGDRVQIEQGPLAGFMGRVERKMDDGQRVAVLLEAIYGARLIVEKDWLMAAESV